MPRIHRRTALHWWLILLACCSIDAAAQTDTAPTGAGHDQGVASYYGHHLRGRKTASGQAYDPNALTAAHRTLPLGTQVRVVNPKNDRSVIVIVNDRGPVAANRMLDVSSAAAEQLGMKKSGVTRVDTQVVGRNSLPKDNRTTASGDASR